MLRVRNRSILCLVVLFFGALACNRNTALGPREFLEYMKTSSHGFAKTVSTEDLVYEFQIKTAEYVAAEELLNGAISKEQCANRISDLNQKIIITVKIKDASNAINPLKKDVKGLKEYNQRINYFLNEAKHFFVLKIGDQEQKMITYLFENNYGTTPFDTVIMGFEIPKNCNDNLELTYDDALFKTGAIHIEISCSDLNNIPKLVI